jgi:ribosomal-protein-serine acetyltransferase
MRDCMSDGRIRVRKFRPGDEAAVYDATIESMEALLRWGYTVQGYTSEDAARAVAEDIALWDQGARYAFAVEELPGPTFVGVLDIAEIEPEKSRAGLGWWVRTSRTRQGIATAAARLVAQAAFEDLHFSLLIVYANAQNMASRRVAEKIGAILTQIRPEDHGIYCAVYELRP